MCTTSDEVSDIPSAHIFFDNNTLGEIHRHGLAPRLVRSLGAVGLEVQATEINLVESYSAATFITDALLTTLRDLTGHDGVLPWTGEVLQLEAAAFLRGEACSQMPLNSLDVLEPGDSRDSLRPRLNAFRKRTDGTHRQLHAQARPHIQQKLKRLGIRPRWDEFPAFLEAWQTLDTREIFAAQSWRDLDVVGPFQPEILEASESWRLMSDADGIGIFQGAIVFKQPTQVQRMDQLQLPYLGGAARRVLVTRDGAFANAAKTVVNGRFHLASVLTFAEFMATSGIQWPVAKAGPNAGEQQGG